MRVNRLADVVKNVELWVDILQAVYIKCIAMRIFCTAVYSTR